MDKNSKGYPFMYIDTLPNTPSQFTHKGVNYVVKYVSGCFYPYLCAEYKNGTIDSHKTYFVLDAFSS